MVNNDGRDSEVGNGILMYGGWLTFCGRSDSAQASVNVGFQSVGQRTDVNVGRE